MQFRAARRRDGAVVAPPRLAGLGAPRRIRSSLSVRVGMLGTPLCTGIGTSRCYRGGISPVEALGLLSMTFVMTMFEVSKKRARRNDVLNKDPIM